MAEVPYTYDLIEISRRTRKLPIDYYFLTEKSIETAKDIFSYLKEIQKEVGDPSLLKDYYFQTKLLAFARARDPFLSDECSLAPPRDEYPKDLGMIAASSHAILFWDLRSILKKE
jgi:hypothetical protein